MPSRTRHRVMIPALLLATPWMMGQGCAPAAPAPQPGGGGNVPGGPNEQLVFSGLNAALLSISGTSATDVYAVGADPGDASGPYVLHYDGGSWRRLRSGASGDLWWISLTPISGDFYMAGTGGKVLQYRSATGVFTAFDTPDDRTAFGVWGADGSSLWAVGGDLDAPDDSGFVWRYDGQSWMSEDLSAVLPQGVPILYKVWGRSGSDLYVVGRLGVVLHYDGSAWTRVPTDTTRTLFTVNGNDTLVAAAGGLGDAVLLEEEGGTFVNRAPAATPQMNGVFVPHDGQAVAAGNLASLARRVNGTWVLQDAAFATTRDFHGVWLDPEGGIWAVGGNLSASLNDGILAYVGPSSIGTSVAE